MANDFSPWSLVTAPVTGLFNAVGAGKQADAAKEAASTQSAAAVKSAQIQADAANQSAQLQAKTAADALQYSRGQSQLSLDQYNQQQTRLQPYRNLGAFALGQPQSDAPAPLTLPALPSSQTAPNASTMPSGSTSGASAGGSDPASYALSLVTGGMTPQQAAQQTNQKFNLQTGSQAVYYPDSNTIGLPNAYLAGPTDKPDSPSKWGIVPRSGGGGSATGAATAGPVKLNYTPSMMSAGAQSTPPTIGTLQAPPMQYRSLAQIGAA